MVEVVPFFELCLHRQQKSGCEIDELSPEAPDSYKLDDARSILSSNYSQVTFVNHNPVKLLLYYKPASILYKVLRQDSLCANQY